jgi:heme-degrading monooxygenase HmoA
VVVVLFRNRLRDDAGDEYATTAKRMLELASAMPGFVSFKTFRADDGERISVIEFESDAHARAWREHPEHRAAQQRGREGFYEEYRLQVCEPIRDYGFRR